jgi:ADP-ribose pyrophosphatase YjhB (NUDIX family)
LPGGRILLGESFETSTQRIMREKFSINAKFLKINSVSLEHVKKGKKIVHTFLLIFVSAKTNDKIEYTEIAKNKSRIISSDYKLLKEDLSKEIKLKNIFSKS